MKRYASNNKDGYFSRLEGNTQYNDYSAHVTLGVESSRGHGIQPPELFSINNIPSIHKVSIES